MSHYKVEFVPNTPNHCWNKAFDLIEANSLVLDVGCSSGAFGRALIEHKACTVDGIEPDQGDYHKAKKYLRRVHNGYVEEALTSVFSTIKYDHIVFLDVIEHLYQPEDVLNLARKNLRPGGSIVFSIPNMAHLSTRIMLLSGDFEYGNTGLLDNTHLHFYTQKEIDRVFEASGYAIETMDFTEATYPTPLIKKEFEKLGLKTTPKAIKIFTEDSAKIFQFVGKAVVSKSLNKVRRIEYSPDPQGQISDYYDGVIDGLNSEIKALRSEVDDCTDIIRDLQHKLMDDQYMADHLPLRKYVKHYIKKKIN